MTDARLPSRWLTDPALDALSDRLWRVHTSALMWCAEHGTDGQVPTRSLRLLHPDGATVEDAQGLVDAGLWMANAEDGYEVADWGRSQSLAADVEAARAAHRERQARYRARLAASAADSEVTHHVTRHATGDVTQQSLRRGEARRGEVSVPEESPSLSSSEIADATPRPDVLRILDALDAALRANGVTKLPTRSKTNLSAARLLLDRDGRTVEQIERAIRFVQGDEFWRANVLSMAKLREKYEQLQLAAQRPGGSPPARRDVPKDQEWMYR